jgi:hypothetical protein
MKTVEYNYGKDPYIPTEETMFQKLKESSVGDEWTLHELPLAHMINNLGAPAAQSVIDSLDPDEKKIFVCQHILVDQLKIDENSVMCSPHASDSNNVISIPHYPVNTSEKHKDRTYLFGFLGSTTTHHTRKGIVKLFPDFCKDSGVHWGLDTKLGDSFSKTYITELANCRFALCPRGTGISSVRMFEAMSMGAIPVIIADGYRPPLSSIIDWDKISITVPEKKIKNINNILSEISLEDMNSMREKMTQAYKEYLSPDNFHKSIELSI